jgi:hypothetical protein
MRGRASWHTKAVLILGLVGVVTVVGFSKDSTESRDSKFQLHHQLQDGHQCPGVSVLRIRISTWDGFTFRGGVT